MADAEKAVAHEASAQSTDGVPNDEVSSDEAVKHELSTGEADAELARKVAEATHAVPTNSRRGRRKKERSSDSARQEAEDFVASVDADLAEGEDDGSDDDELSAAGPDSSELVAGPRDFDN